MKVLSNKTGYFALSLLSLAISQAVFAAEEPVGMQPTTGTSTSN